MKTFLIGSTVLGICLGQFVFAQDSLETIEIVRSKAVVPMTLNLNKKTVRCLVGDYGASSLKISVPELKMHTVFRQTTWGETEPCINAGPCKRPSAPNAGGLDPSLILNDQKPTEDVNVTVVLKEVLTLDHGAQTCQRELQETLESDVRGLNFQHADGASLGNLDYNVCLKMAERK